MKYLQNINITIPPLFKSKRAWVAIITALVELAVIKDPSFEPVREQLITAGVAVCLTLVSGYSLQDAIVAWKTGMLPERYQ